MLITNSETTEFRCACPESGSVVEVDYIEPDVQYDLIGGGSGYSGLDQFHRIVDSLWKNSTTSIDRVQYGYDRVSSRMYRKVPTDTSNKFDELYSHDGIHRLDDLKRGQLNGSHTSMANTDFQQAWTLDETGNWSNFKQDNNGNGTWDLDQDRTSNKVNEITDLDNTAGSQWGTPQYDRAGNMTRIPNNESSTFSWSELTVDDWYDLTVDEWYGLPATTDDEPSYDAWNRIVRLNREGKTLQISEYDALRRRTVAKSYADGILEETRHTYFTSAWQVIEERVDSDNDADRQNVWGIRYIDDLILRDRDTTGNGTLDERLYALQDANWNVTSVCDTSGTIQERYAYDAYGKPLFLNAAYANKTSSSYDWKTLFAGYHFDAAPRLYQVRNRSFAPELGSWLQRDPIDYSVGTMNLYEYALSQPATMTDSLGLDCGGKGSCSADELRRLWNSQQSTTPRFGRGNRWTPPHLRHRPLDPAGFIKRLPPRPPVSPPHPTILSQPQPGMFGGASTCSVGLYDGADLGIGGTADGGQFELAARRPGAHNALVNLGNVNSPADLDHLLGQVVAQTGQNITEISLYDHGGGGICQIGADRIRGPNGEQYAKAINPHLAPNARVLLYNCCAAKGVKCDASFLKTTAGILLQHAPRIGSVRACEQYYYYSRTKFREPYTKWDFLAPDGTKDADYPWIRTYDRCYLDRALQPQAERRDWVLDHLQNDPISPFWGS